MRFFPNSLARIFVPRENIWEGKVILSPAEARYLVRVLRLKQGEQITIFDNSGRECLIVLEKTSSRGVEGRILSEKKIDRDPSKKITLLAALLKGEKFNWIVQKSTELGVSQIVPLETQYTVVHLNSARVREKISRWQKIAQEAARQSGRTSIPEIHFPRTLLESFAVVKEVDLAIIPWESEESLYLRDLLTRECIWEKVALFIGPEGGFTPEEIRKAREAGLIPVSLGSRILRAETAALAAMATILYVGGDLG